MEVYLLILTLLSIVIVIVGVSWLKWHAFISLTVASLFLAVLSGMPLGDIVGAYETGVGGVLGHLVGILALGTILGKMLSESGAGLQIASYFIRTFGENKLPWAMFSRDSLLGFRSSLRWAFLSFCRLLLLSRKRRKRISY